MFSVTRTYKVTFHHPRGSILGRDVCLSDAAFTDRKSLAAQLRKAGVLSAGARVTAFRGEAGGRVVLERRTPQSSLESLPVVLECIPFDMPHARLAMGKAEPGQTIDNGDTVITTTLHRLEPVKRWKGGDCSCSRGGSAVYCECRG